MAIAAKLPEKVKVEAGRGKPRTCLPSRGPAGQGAVAQPRVPGRRPLGDGRRGRLLQKQQGTHPAEIKHPSWSGTRAGSARCLGRHGNMPRGGLQAALTARDTHSIVGFPAAGCAAAGLSRLLASAKLGAPAALRARWSRQRLPSPPAPASPLEG